MSSPNTALWDNLGRTDPNHTKAFKRGGGFTGTAIKPIWSYRRMTEEFGPCGLGWGIGEPTFQVVAGENREIAVYCTASIWYRQDENEAPRTVYGVGGDKVVTHIKANDQYKRPERWETDDEAFKKAFTDAITNALKMIGVGADVHMGLFDDNKYVNSMREEFAEDRPQAANKSSASLKREDAWGEFQRDLQDVKTIHGLNKCKAEWREKVVRDGWAKAWIAAMPDEFAALERHIMAANDAAETSTLRAG